MILTTAPDGARWGTRIRLAILIAVALLVAHTAIYAAEDGLGAAFVGAMSAGGHDGWWIPAGVLVIVSALVVAATGARRLLRLESRARHLESRRAGDASFRGEVGAIARRLVPLVLALFALQENLEGIVAHGRVIGIEALIGPVHPLAIPVLVGVALALSMAGAVVRWRIATLRHRIAVGRRRFARRGRADGVASRRTISEDSARRWTLGRLDAGRSPPIVVAV